ncbi:hypothetical protein WG904_12180 [Pedobacter sp. Du54]|uniref:hypothetical protein n=1 Tax=Pedobacter anseongensis TaxID=3133439 RepID=UPI0030B1FB83
MSCDGLRAKLDPENLHAQCFSSSHAASENGKRFEIIRPGKLGVCKVRVDGCLITNQAIRKCDYFFGVATDPESYFLVELKGSDLSTAVSQLESTYDQLRGRIEADPRQFTAVVVSSMVPAKSNAVFRTMQAKLLKNRGLNIDLKNVFYQVRIQS